MALLKDGYLVITNDQDITDDAIHQYVTNTYIPSMEGTFAIVKNKLPVIHPTNFITRFENYASVLNPDKKLQWAAITVVNDDPEWVDNHESFFKKAHNNLYSFWKRRDLPKKVIDKYNLSAKHMDEQDALNHKNFLALRIKEKSQNTTTVKQASFLEKLNAAAGPNAVTPKKLHDSENGKNDKDVEVVKTPKKK